MMNRYNYWDSDDSDSDDSDVDDFDYMDSYSDSDFSISASNDFDDFDDFDDFKSTDFTKSLDFVLDGLNLLRKELIFCDITLTAGEREFRVHRNVISANCGLFRTMFSGICSETDEEIPIDRIDPDCLELLIEFMYTGSLILDSNNAEEFLSAASFLQMEKLEEFCKKIGCTSFPKNDYTRYLLKGLNQFRQNGTFCDVTLKVGERTFPVHKNVMSSVSLFFKNVCLDKEEICLNEVDADILESLVDYMYTGNLKIDLNNVKTILMTNSRLQISNVNKLCCDFIFDKLEVETFAEYWDFSKNNSIECLRDSLMEKAVAIFPVLCPKIEFEFEEMKHIIEAMKEKGTPEDLLFSFLMRWINHSEEPRVKYTKDLLELLQPSLISPNLFRSLEIVNASNPMFTSWANRRHSYLSLNDPSEYILLYPSFEKIKPRRINLFSETEDIGINFPQLIMRCGTFVCHGYYIYYQGGQTNGDVVAETLVYHPTKRVWTPFVPLLQARYRHRSCVLNQKIFNVGGFDGAGLRLASVEFTDLLTGQRAFTDPMPSSKLLLGLAVHENSMYIVGDNTYRFDTREGVWQSLPPLPSNEMLKSCGIVGESIYLSEENTLHRYDICANQWESIVTQRECFISGNVFSVNNTLYGVSEVCIGRYIPEERRWVKQRTWTNKKINITSWHVATNFLNPVIWCGSII